MPLLGRGDRRGALVQHTQKMKAVAYLPTIVVTRDKTDGFLGQYLREIDQPTPPFELTVVAHLPYRDTAVVFNGVAA